MGGDERRRDSVSGVSLTHDHTEEPRVTHEATATEEDKLRVRWDVIVTVVAWLVGGLLAYGALDARIRVLESQYLGTADDIREIKSDIKQLLRRP